MKSTLWPRLCCQTDMNDCRLHGHGVFLESALKDTFHTCTACQCLQEDTAISNQIKSDQIRSNQIKSNVGNFPGRRKRAALSVTLYRCLCKASSNFVAILVFQHMGSWFPCSASGVSINLRYVDARLHTPSDGTMYVTQILVDPRIADVKNFCNLQVLGRQQV